MLCSVPRLSARGLSIPRRGIAPVCSTEVRAHLASIPTIVTVAGQTQVHAANIDGAGATTVPSMVPHPFRGGHICHKLESGEETFRSGATGLTWSSVSGLENPERPLLQLQHLVRRCPVDLIVERDWRFCCHQINAADWRTLSDAGVLPRRAMS